jgi:hypothetical protein
MLPIRLLRAAALCLAVAFTACGDPTLSKAYLASAPNSYSLYTLTGAPANVPNAVNFLGGPTRASASFAFDIAFDLDAQGRVMLYPVRTVGGALAGGLKRVGLQQVAGAYETLREVPKDGYDTLSVKIVSPGAVLAVELQDLNTCLTSFGGSNLYAKLVIDSVQAGPRRIFARSVVDPNCGYRMVVPDSIPSF